MKIRIAVNKHGCMFKFVGHHNGDVVVIAKNQGEFARWDDGVNIGLIRHGSGALGRIGDREQWEAAVKITASMMRSE